MKLLSINADAKTIKGQKQGVLTGILYLSPYNLSGVNFCPWSTKGCREGCLYTSGRAKMFETVNRGRLRKSKLWLEDKAEFMRQLAKDIGALIRKADREDMLPAVRLNGTSDILWEEETDIMAQFPGVQFYDYTKAPLDKRTRVPANYHLTYSVSESRSSWTRARRYLDAGHCAAVVFGTKAEVQSVVANGWRGYPCVDGDDSDIRFGDPAGHIVALKAKGDAKQDTTGFVRRLRVLA